MVEINLQDAEIAHQIQLIKAGNQLGNDVKPYIKNLMAYVREVLSRSDTITTIKQRDEYIKLILAKVDSELGSYTEELQKSLTEIAKEEINFNAAILANGTLVAKSAIKRPKQKDLKKLINNTYMVLGGKAKSVDEYLGEFASVQGKSIKDIIIAGWSNGETTSSIARQIVGTTTVNGQSQIILKGAMMRAKDLTSHVSSVSKAKFGEDNRGVIIGEETVATLDSRTSDYCQNADGQVYLYSKYGDKVPRPPFHPFCRSTNIFVVSDEYKVDDHGTRPSVVDGEAKEVSTKETYFEWAKRQPMAFKEEALGKTRAQILDNMSAAEFKKVAYNQLGESISIEEMIKRSKTVAKLLKE